MGRGEGEFPAVLVCHGRVSAFTLHHFAIASSAVGLFPFPSKHFPLYLPALSPDMQAIGVTPERPSERGTSWGETGGKRGERQGWQPSALISWGYRRVPFLHIGPVLRARALEKTT